MILFFKKNDIDFSINKDESIHNVIKKNNLTYANLDYKFDLFYEGDESDINDLVNIIDRLFKKHKTVKNEVSFFDVDSIELITTFIDDEIKKENFDISNKKQISSYIENILRGNDEDIFMSCLTDLNDNLELSLCSHTNIDYTECNYNNSYFIKFVDNIQAKLFFDAIKMDSNGFNIITGETILIIKKWSTNIHKLIKFKLNLLKTHIYTKIIYMDTKPSMQVDGKKFLSSTEVCKLMTISRQKLSYWRKNNFIKYKKISDRKYVYSSNQISQLMEDVLLNNLIPKKEPNVIKYEQPIIKKESRLDRLKKTFEIDLLEAPFEENIDYNTKIKEWVDFYSNKIPKHKFTNQHFFLNFGNIGFVSSPHVMINDDLQLVDFIKGTIIKNSPSELLEYLNNLTETGKEPRIDTSKKIYQGYSKFYLRKINM